jgi:hypothetical protein
MVSNLLLISMCFRLHARRCHVDRRSVAWHDGLTGYGSYRWRAPTGRTDSSASAARRRRPGLCPVHIHCSCYCACQVPMLTMLGLAGFGGYWRRTRPLRRLPAASAARRRQPGLCPVVTSGERSSAIYLSYDATR